MTVNELIAMATSEEHRVVVQVAWCYGGANEVGHSTMHTSFLAALAHEMYLTEWPTNRLSDVADYRAIFGEAIVLGEVSDLYVPREPIVLVFS